MTHFPDDWIKPKEFSFDRDGNYLLTLQNKSDNISHGWIEEVRNNIAEIRRKYLPRLYWMKKYE